MSKKIAKADIAIESYNFFFSINSKLRVVLCSILVLYIMCSMCMHFGMLLFQTEKCTTFATLHNQPAGAKHTGIRTCTQTPMGILSWQLGRGGGEREGGGGHTLWLLPLHDFRRIMPHHYHDYMLY